MLPVQAAVWLRGAAGPRGPRDSAGNGASRSKLWAASSRGAKRSSGRGHGQPAEVALEREQGQGRRVADGLLLFPRQLACHAEGQELHGLGKCAGTTSSSREKREKKLGQVGWGSWSRSSPHNPTPAGLGAMELTRHARRPSSSGSSGRTDKFSASGEWSFPPRLVHFLRTRQTPSYPQTVALRLLRPNQFTLKSKPAALYSMHLGRNQNIVVGRCVTLLVITVFTSKEVRLRCA